MEPLQSKEKAQLLSTFTRAARGTTLTLAGVGQRGLVRHQGYLHCFGDLRTNEREVEPISLEISLESLDTDTWMRRS